MSLQEIKKWTGNIFTQYKVFVGFGYGISLLLISLAWLYTGFDALFFLLGLMMFSLLMSVHGVVYGVVNGLGKEILWYVPFFSLSIFYVGLVAGVFV